MVGDVNTAPDITGDVGLCILAVEIKGPLLFRLVRPVVAAFGEPILNISRLALK